MENKKEWRPRTFSFGIPLSYLVSEKECDEDINLNERIIEWLDKNNIFGTINIHTVEYEVDGDDYNSYFVDIDVEVDVLY